MTDNSAGTSSSTPDGYVSFVAHIWVGENGKIIRGTIEDIHTGTRLALDLSELGAFLRTSLLNSPGQMWNAPDQEEGRHEKGLNERPGEGSTEIDTRDDHPQNEKNQEK